MDGQQGQAAGGLLQDLPTERPATTANARGTSQLPVYGVPHGRVS